MLFSLLKHYLDTDLKVSQSVYFFTTSISHGVENYFPRLWGTGISGAIFRKYFTNRGCIIETVTNRFHKTILYILLCVNLIHGCVIIYDNKL